MLEKTNNSARFRAQAVIIRKHVEEIVERHIVDQSCELRELRELAEHYAKRPPWDYGHRAREILAKYGSKEEWVGK